MVGSRMVSFLRRRRPSVERILDPRAALTYPAATVMKFAFSTVSCPAWDFDTIAARANEYGYDGVEIRGSPNDAILTAANVFLSDIGKVRRIFDAAGVEIACLAS